jgi:Fic family protein
MLFIAPPLPDSHLRLIDRIAALRRQLRHVTSDNLNRWNGLLARLSYARLIHQSNTMEGVRATFDQAVAAVDGEHPADPDSHDWQALTGHRDAMDYIIQLAKEPSLHYSEGGLLGLHFMMLKHDLSKNPGRYRPGAVQVSDARSGQRVYEAPPREHVQPLMGELIASLNGRSSDSVLVRAALAHLNLTMIHPFRDGNGRMARALQTLVLAREGILDPRFSSIEEYVGRNASQYYDVLALVGQGSWSPTSSTLPWIEFCLRAHFNQAQRLLRRIEEVDALWTQLEACCSELNLPTRVLDVLARAASGMTIRSATHRHEGAVSAQVAKRDLKQLVDKGLLLPSGEKRGRTYQRSDRLRQLWQQTRIQRDWPDAFDPQT